MDLDQFGPNFRHRAYQRDMSAHFHATDPVLHIVAIEPGLATLRGVVVLEADVDLLQHPQQVGLVQFAFDHQAVLDHVKRNGPVHGPAVDVGVAQVMRQLFRKRAFSAAAEAVYGDIDATHGAR